jgi:hypothetical protein
VPVDGSIIAKAVDRILAESLFVAANPHDHVGTDG